MPQLPWAVLLGRRLPGLTLNGQRTQTANDDSLTESHTRLLVLKTVSEGNRHRTRNQNEVQTREDLKLLREIKLEFEDFDNRYPGLTTFRPSSDLGVPYTKLQEKGQTGERRRLSGQGVFVK